VSAARVELKLSVGRPAVNRRHFARAAVDLPAQYAVAGQPPWRASTIVDIGAGGVRLQTLDDIANVRNLTIRFALEGNALCAVARIVLSAFDRSRQCFISGAAFTAIDPQARQQIAQHVTELRARGTT
jgi:hypothetical protein